MTVDLIEIKATDGVNLDGLIYKSNSKKIIIATHGMGSNCFKEREKIIAKYANKNNIDFMIYNNRGSELIRYIKKEIDGQKKKILAGTTFEDVKEGYYDLKGAIQKAIDLGYKEIYLQGHSLGSTKTVYLYNKLKEQNDEILKYIKGIVLLSLVDIPKVLKIYLNKNFENYLKLAEEKENKNEIYDLMPKESFIHPISVKSFLIYSKYNKDFDFARFSDFNFQFEILNKIEIPIFMRWGNINEMIEQDAKDLVKIVNEKIKNSHKDIDFIDGADHAYSNKEEILSQQIIEFLNKI